MPETNPNFRYEVHAMPMQAGQPPDNASMKPTAAPNEPKDAAADPGAAKREPAERPDSGPGSRPAGEPGERPDTVEQIQIAQGKGSKGGIG